MRSLQTLPMRADRCRLCGSVGQEPLHSFAIARALYVRLVHQPCSAAASRGCMPVVSYRWRRWFRPGTGVALQAVRMVRIFRVFKLGKYVQGLNLFKETLQLSAPALGVCPAMRPDRTGCPAMFRESRPLALPLPAQLSTHSASFSSKCDSARSRIECTVASQVLAFIIVIAIVLFSSVMFYAEKDLPLENHFESIPASMWLNRHAASSHRRWRPRALFEHAPCL